MSDSPEGALDGLRRRALAEIQGAIDADQLEQARIHFLGRQSELAALFQSLKALSAEERRRYAAPANLLKQELMRAIEAQAASLERGRLESLASAERLDLTAPVAAWPRGHLHPLSQVRAEVERIFAHLGYVVEDGSEIETEYYNFEALNMPPGHPARDSQDSFYLPDGRLLRTQTSGVQVHAMERLRPPIRIIAPGRCYRRDAEDASHLAVFHQVEGLAVDQGLSVADLKGTLQFFAQSYFGQERSIRLRPDYFPFTEPSFEVAVSCGICGGRGCRSCAQSGWLEILGAGMVHPRLLEGAGIPPGEYSGFAFGMGLERLAMLRYDVHDIRLFYESDVRFLEQF